MTPDLNSNSSPERTSKQSLIYDTDGVTLMGRYVDELSAYRSRRSWMEVLSNYFLLEVGRDYEMKVSFDGDTDYFVLSCPFSSACGRYAFWRLINHQAPEAEERLAAGLKKPPKAVFPSILGQQNVESSTPWVLVGNDGGRPRKKTITDRLLSLFRLA